MAKINHIHKYKRIRYKTGFTIFRCVLENCPHFIRSELVLGRKCICWRCETPFILRKNNLSKPHCENCTKGKEKEKFSNAIDTLLNVLG